MSSKSQSQFRRNPSFTEREKIIATVECKKYFSNFNVHQNQLGILLKIDSDSVNLGWGPGTGFSHKFLGDADVAGPTFFQGQERWSEGCSWFTKCFSVELSLMTNMLCALQHM